MAKKKSSNKKRGTATSTAVVSKKASVPRPVPQAANAIVKAVCSLTDPFCESALGSRWPDHTTSPTLPFHVEKVVTLTTDASGQLGRVFFPGFPYCDLTGTIVASTWTGGGSYLSFSSDVATWATSNCDAVRPVSFGVEFIPIASATNSSGYYILQENRGGNTVTSTLQVPSVVGGKATVSNLKNIATSWISRPYGPGAREFQAQNDSGNQKATEQDWTSLNLQIQGAPASTAVAVARIVGNYEVLIKTQNVMNSAAKSTPPNPVVMRAAGIAQTSLESFFRGTGDKVYSFVHAAARQALYSAGAGMAGRLLGPAGYALGRAPTMIMDVD